MLVAAVLISSRIQIETDDGVGSGFESGEPFELFSQRHTPPHPWLAREFTANRVPAPHSFQGRGCSLASRVAHGLPRQVDYRRSSGGRVPWACLPRA